MAVVGASGRRDCAAEAAPCTTAPDGGDGPIFRVGLLADAHYADAPDRNDRYYRASIDKLREAVGRFNRVKVDFAVELGDFIDAADTLWREIGYLRTIEAAYAVLNAPRHYVLGNHCVATLSKREFVLNSGARDHRSLLPASAIRKFEGSRLDPTIPCDTDISGLYYSFDHKGFHFVILDACYRPDGAPYCRGDFEWTVSYVPKAQQEWLREDLGATSHPTIVFIHQRLDTGHPYGVVNAAEVRGLLEGSGKVRAVFQGHDHAGDLQRVGGIPYCTLSAMVTGPASEAGAYGLLEAFADGRLRLQGFRGQETHELTFPGATTRASRQTPTLSSPGEGSS